MSGWRKIKGEDIRRGTMLRFGNMNDTFDKCVILSDPDVHGNVKLARPYCYAQEDYDNNQPLLGAETFSMSANRMLEDNSDIEVFEDRNESIRKFLT